jgi:hypothetical protein
LLPFSSTLLAGVEQDGFGGKMPKQFPILIFAVVLFTLYMSGCAAPEGPAETLPATGVIPETGLSEEGMPVWVSIILENEPVDDQENLIGRVIEVILNPFGLPQYLVIAAENKYTLVPWTAFLWHEDQERVVFGLDQALIEGAPSFSSLEEFPAFDIAGWDMNIAEYWVEYVDMPGEREQQPVEWDVPRQVTLALQSEVIDFEGDQIAVVEEVLYNPVEERGYVVVIRDGQFLPTPWEEFDWDQINNRLIYLYEIERPDNAPAYGSLEEMSTKGSEWDAIIRQYWSTP